MSTSSPSDLAVTFRSVARRRREAQADAPAHVTAGPQGELDRCVAAAAGILHAPPDPALVADAIDAVPAEGWADLDLDGLRTIALDIGRLLREIERLAADAS
jgi:hypothetical protein